MKKSILLFLLLSFVSVKAQKNEMKAKILERKLAFFKENLMLDKEESSAFEDLYKKYMKQKQELRQRFKQEVIDKLKNDNLNELSENEQQEIVTTKMDIDQKRCSLDKDFTLALIKVLPARKVIRYFKLERDFNRKLMKRFKKRNKQKRKSGKQ